MDHDFWHQRWQQDKTGFHQPDTNPLLIKYQPRLGLSKGDEIFVPLCGKSRDMLWLHEQGYQVVGVELSDLALNAFFASNHIPHRNLQAGKFKLYQATGYRLYGGDFFGLNATVVQSCKLVYDRAALIAFPEDMRKQYATHLVNILPEAASILLVGLDYPQDQMSGPPFSVPEAEIEFLFGDHFKLELLERENVLTIHEKFREQGLQELHESVYLLTRR